ncbi:MAG: hypothetical protein M1450_01090 [Patescibacteria group bacterium]|nr:hypothetical protein [Patescibacteria group bacterium]
MFKKVVYFFIFWKTIVFYFSYLASLIIPLNLSFTLFKREPFLFKHAYFPEYHLPYFVLMWANFDGFYYLNIAKRGYFTLEYGFFPFYPYLIKVFNFFWNMPNVISAQIISNLAFAVSLFFVGRLLALDKQAHIKSFVFLCIIFFPTSFFYGAVYNDSLFFMLSLICIYLARNRKYFFSGVFGFFATLTRLNGLALFPLIFFEFVMSTKSLKQQWNFGDFLTNLKILYNVKKLIKQGFYAIFFVPAGFLIYLFYINSKTGTFASLFSSMEVWNQNKMVLPPQVVFRYFKIVSNPVFHLNYFIAILELLFFLFYILLLIYSWKKIRFSYWIFFAVSILIPSLTGTFQGMPRYALHIYPLFLTIALFFKTKGLLMKFIYFALSIAILFLFVSLFTRGYFVA